jgi:hypothetical protein
MSEKSDAFRALRAVRAQIQLLPAVPLPGPVVLAVLPVAEVLEVIDARIDRERAKVEPVAPEFLRGHVKLDADDRQRVRNALAMDVLKDLEPLLRRSAANVQNLREVAALGRTAALLKSEAEK